MFTILGCEFASLPPLEYAINIPSARFLTYLVQLFGSLFIFCFQIILSTNLTIKFHYTQFVEIKMSLQVKKYIYKNGSIEEKHMGRMRRNHASCVDKPAPDWFHLTDRVIKHCNLAQQKDIYNHRTIIFRLNTWIQWLQRWSPCLAFVKSKLVPVVATNCLRASSSSLEQFSARANAKHCSFKLQTTDRAVRSFRELSGYVSKLKAHLLIGVQLPGGGNGVRSARKWTWCPCSSALQ